MCVYGENNNIAIVYLFYGLDILKIITPVVKNDFF